MILQWGKGDTGRDIYMPITFPQVKWGDIAIHHGQEKTVNIVSNSIRIGNKGISHFITNSTVNNGTVFVCWIAFGC